MKDKTRTKANRRRKRKAKEKKLMRSTNKCKPVWLKPYCIIFTMSFPVGITKDTVLDPLHNKLPSDADYNSCSLLEPE